MLSTQGLWGKEIGCQVERAGAELGRLTIRVERRAVGGILPR